MNLLIVIPAYNASSTLGEVIKQCREYTDNIFVIDDGSSDETFNVAIKSEVLCLQHEHNQGKGNALKTAFKEAHFSNADIILTIDADGQHSTKDIPSLIAPILAGSDICIGSRYLKPSKETKPIRRVGQKILDKLLHIVGARVLTDTQSGMRSYRASIVKEFLDIPDQGFSFESKVILKACELNLKISEVPIECSYLGLDCHTTNFAYQGFSVFASLMAVIIKTKVMGC